MIPLRTDKAVALLEVTGGWVWIIHEPDKPTIDKFVVKSGKKRNLMEAIDAARTAAGNRVAYYHVLNDTDGL